MLHEHYGTEQVHMLPGTRRNTSFFVRAQATSQIRESGGMHAILAEIYPFENSVPLLLGAVLSAWIVWSYNLSRPSS